ncbi:MAG TPA: hypothetical protein VFI06_06820 [Chitinophagaceae bacterium]|nr:hypothetical protein [Chitinophagaceae bacterium]
MKKYLVVIMLAATSMNGDLFAQNNWSYLVGRSKTEQVFDLSRSPSLRHRFVIWLKNSNSVSVQVANKEEFEKLLNLDSIIRVVAKNLVPCRDSLQDEMIQKKIDYVNEAGGLVKLRIRQYQQNGTSYVIQPDGAALLKLEQDTLNISSYQSKETLSPGTTTYVYVHYRISVLINDINKLESLADGTLNKIMEELKEQWDGLDSWSSKKNNTSNLYAYFNTGDSNLNRPLRNQAPAKKWVPAPYVQVGLQNVNNILTTSIGAGFVLTKGARTALQYRFQLFWEPYFFFDREPDNSFAMRRNDFITLQFVTRQTNNFPNGAKVEFNQNLSVGYLVHREGNYFFDHTFKAGLPGASFKFLMLHPEFIFHDLFKDFQPGLKLVLDLD